ncbi:hypothetical protein AF71_00036410 [Rhizobium sp. 57MFTsu3.2]|nr:hypothetical protein [Rhizobium sp. 57MFTsu3.2]
MACDTEAYSKKHLTERNVEGGHIVLHVPKPFMGSVTKLPVIRPGSVSISAISVGLTQTRFLRVPL